MNYGFNPHTHKGCDKMRSCVSYALVLFQSTHPRGVRPFFHFMRLFVLKFQSTHPRGVRPLPSADFDALGMVSIHAPTRGATSPYEDEYQKYYVSIHAPTRGATELSSHGWSMLTRFQSTHPRGVRLLSLILKLILNPFQSTHPRGVRPPHAK